MYARYTTLTAAYIVDVKAKSLTTNGFQRVIKLGLLKERCFDSLDMREFIEELEFKAQLATESQIFEQDGHTSTDHTFSNADGKHDLRVDLGLQITLCHIQDIVRRERNSPVHAL